MKALERINIETSEDRLQSVLHRARYDFVLDRLKGGETILEIGTGPGVFSKELLARSGRYKGIEYDKDTCEEARRQTDGKAEIIQADARNLPLADSEFSLVVCLEVLEHLGDWRAGVQSIHRCLKSDGTAIVSVPYRRIGGKSESNPYHLYEPGEQELISLFRRLFSDVKVYYQFFAETRWMTFARTFHIRRLFGLEGAYAGLSNGQPQQISRLKIEPKPRGMKISVILTAKGKKPRT